MVSTVRNIQILGIYHTKLFEKKKPIDQASVLKNRVQDSAII